MQIGKISEEKMTGLLGKALEKENPSSKKGLSTTIFKCSRFYQYIQIDYEQFIRYRKIGTKNGKDVLVSFAEYVKHCYINNKFRITSKIQNNDTIYSYVGNRKTNEKYKFTWGIRNKSYGFFIAANTFCKVSRVTADILDSVQDTFGEETSPFVRIEFYGINATKYKKKFVSIYKKMVKLEEANLDNYAYISSMDDEYDELGTRVILKTFDQIFMKKDQKETIIKCIDNIIKMNNLQLKYNLSPKYGILLYGKPGTGKTSIIKAIVNNITDRMVAESRCNSFIVCSIDVSCSLDKFRAILNKCKNYAVRASSQIVCIYIIEEIDAIMNVTRDKDTGEANAKIKLLLEFIDGFSTPNGASMLFLASTNYYERLDPALRRDGRFDLRIELDDLGKEEAKEMLKHFGLSGDIKIFDGKSWNEIDKDFKVNPAELQNIILRYLANREEE